jgi:hypothetical protein
MRGLPIPAFGIGHLSPVCPRRIPEPELNPAISQRGPEDREFELRHLSTAPVQRTASGVTEGEGWGSAGGGTDPPWLKADSSFQEPGTYPFQIR